MFNIGQRSLPSIMGHSFAQVPKARIPRSQFKRMHEWKSTFNADYLVPFYWDEVYPGDTAQMNFAAICRMITPETPFMDNLYLDFFFFFTPNRILQTNFVKMMGEQEDPDDTIDYATPKIDTPVGGFVPPTDWSAPTTAQLSGALYDYFGYPTRVAFNDSKLPHNYLGRAYNLQWNDWFRDENLQDPAVRDRDDGPDTYTDYILRKRGKRHDYFTSCLPWLQKGVAEDLPLGTSAPIKYDVISGSTAPDGKFVNLDGDAGTATVATYANTFGGASAGAIGNPSSQNIYVDLTAATAATIGQLYESFAIQDLLQTDARGGTRYIELVNSHFGVTAPDYRMQRPEYLGGRSTPFMISPLAQTSETASTELGTLGATVTGAPSNISFFKSFVEHGWIMGLLCVRADLTYQQGMHRSLTRSTRYDFYFPALANLAEQAVLNMEIYCDGSAADLTTFGFQERWSELRYGKSQITGRMRSNDPTSLDVWHLSEDFASLPLLNDGFIEQNTPIERVTAVTSEPHFKIDIVGSGNWVRPMPLYSVPGLMNRF